MSEPAGWVRALRRVRTPLVLLPLVVVLLVAASAGASRLFADLPERAAPLPEVTCWDGATALEGQCTDPAGRAGLRWLFPSFVPSDARCTRVRRPGSAEQRPLEYACVLTLDQRAVTITYSARTSLTQGLGFLRRTYGDLEPVADAEAQTLLFAARRPSDEGLFHVTLAYAEHPYSVTVEAPERGLRDTALNELVELRPASEVAALG